MMHPGANVAEAGPTAEAQPRASTSGYESDADAGPLLGPRLRIGCALLPKKAARYLTPAMLKAARQRGMELCSIDYTRPLLEQGTFDAIVHKLRPNKDWERNLDEYLRLHPGTTVIDRVDGIRSLQNRATMLLPLQSPGISLERPKAWDSWASHTVVQSPRQVEIPEGMALSEATALLEQAGLRPPLLVKPLWTDGREGSHGLAVLHDMGALGRILQGSVSSDVKPPLVVQQFVEHGGVLYKVYVLGRRTVVCRRPSLGDSHLGHEARKKGVLSLPRISCKSTYHKDSPEYKLSCGVVDANSASASYPDAPPDWLTHALAGSLRSALGLQLFNFDLICPEEQAGADSGQCLYYVVDINYFPGVDKIPNFEAMFVDFLTEACNGCGDAADAPDSSASDHSAALLPQQP